MIIDRKKWEESGSKSDKLDFIQAAFEFFGGFESVIVEKCDLILMCKFLLEEVNTLKRENAERKGGKE